MEAAASRRGMCGKHYQRVWKSERSCSVHGCERPYAAKGMCGLHYKRTRKGQSFDAPILGSGKDAGCGVDGCFNPYHANGYCGVHAQRLRRTGDPLRLLAPRHEGPQVCKVDDCAVEVERQGYCYRHYKIWTRHGTPTPDHRCKNCGETFEQDGSYFYCANCHPRMRAGFRAKRVARLADNNVGMTAACHRNAAQYRTLISADPCVYCGSPSVAIDHIDAINNGGSDEWLNLAPICKRCNSQKRDRTVLGTLMFMLEGSTRAPRSRPKAVA